MGLRHLKEAVLILGGQPVVLVDIKGVRVGVRGLRVSQLGCKVNVLLKVPAEFQGLREASSHMAVLKPFQFFPAQAEGVHKGVLNLFGRPRFSVGVEEGTFRSDALVDVIEEHCGHAGFQGPNVAQVVEEEGGQISGKESGNWGLMTFHPLGFVIPRENHDRVCEKQREEREWLDGMNKGKEHGREITLGNVEVPESHLVFDVYHLQLGRSGRLPVGEMHRGNKMSQEGLAVGQECHCFLPLPGVATQEVLWER